MKLTSLLIRTIIVASLFGFFSCANSPKSIITSGDEWIISNSTALSDDGGKGIVFKKDNQISIADGKSYEIDWLDNTMYTQDLNGKMLKVKMRKMERHLLQCVFLFDTDEVPESDDEWDVLITENKVKYLIRNYSNVEEKTVQYLKVGDASILAEKVPPAGNYFLGHGSIIKVLITDGVVKFYKGEKINNLIEVMEVDMDTDGNFKFADEISSYYRYVGNGVIENSGSYYNGMTEGTSEFIKKEISNDENNDVQLLFSNEFGSFDENNLIRVRYSDIKSLVDLKYSDYSASFNNLIFEIDNQYELPSSRYSYPFDLLVILFKIYPDHKSLMDGNDSRLVSIGGVVFEKRYGTWLLANKNLMLVPINEETSFRWFERRNPEINRSKGTIQFQYFEKYIIRMGQSKATQRSYVFGPYLEKVIAIRKRANSEPEYEEW